MNLGVQYYRAPFPESRFWEDDMRRMRDAGLNTVQLWLLWSWIEAKPGHYVFDDYDRLVELSGSHGLGVVLSTIAEIQPDWIHREVPDSDWLLINSPDPTKRTGILARLSSDEGATWPGHLMLDDRDFVSYPDAAVAADGAIYAVHDRDRGGAGEILLSIFRKEKMG